MWVIFKHGLKNAFPPIVTVIGIQTSSLLSGAILTETIFSWPGIGKLIVAAIGNRVCPGAEFGTLCCFYLCSGKSAG
jgi:peptide/nickel transport system permease protein